MKTKKMIPLIAAIMISISTSVFAQTAEQAGKKQAVVSLKGMKCSFCAQGLPKAFKAQPEVENIKVTMDPQQVLVNFKEGKTLSDEKITEIIKDAGINVDKIERK